MRWLVLIVIAVFWVNCSGPSQISGGSSDSGNPCVIANIIGNDGVPVAGAEVTLVPAQYLMPVPFAKIRAVGDVRRTFTDDSGRFKIDSLDIGEYCIEVNDQTERSCRIHCKIIPDDGTRELGNFVLQPYSSIVGMFVTTGTAGVKRYLQIYGLQRIEQIRPDGSFQLDSLPADTFKMHIVSIDNSVPPIDIDQVTTIGGDTTRVRWPWRFTKRLHLNTTATGAGVPGYVVGFPVLVRLTSENFDFSAAQPGGGDLRFAKPDGTEMAYEVERWDAVTGQAEIWVRVDTVYGNTESQYFDMFWGNSTARAVSNAATVFDTTVGFQGVWHLRQDTGAKVMDATVNHYDGTLNGTRIITDGMIGAARDFNGSTDFIEIPNTAGSKLNFAEHGTYAISAWVYSNAIDSTYRMIVSKGDYQYSLEVMDSCTWEFSECQTTGLTTEGFDVTQSPATAQVWTYVTGVRDGERQYLFVDGVCVDSGVQSLSAPQTHNSSSDVMIGRRSDEPMYFFNGKIDEVRMTSMALSADWIKLCYMNQKAADALVVFE
jgi:hypothetical protein